MDHFQLPRGFVPVSLAITAVVGASWWVNYELIPVMNAVTTFVPIYLLVLTARVVLGLAFCGASVGIGMGGCAASTTCFRYLNRTRSLRPLVRYSKSCLATIVALIVFFVSYGIGFISIGATGILALSVMFVGLQVGEFFLLHRIHSRRQTKQEVQS